MTEFGHLLETFVVGELFKQASWHDDVREVVHWHTHDDQEVDCVIETYDLGVIGFEVKARSETVSKDLGGLRLLRELLGPQFRAGFVLTTGEYSGRLEDRIYTCPIGRELARSGFGCSMYRQVVTRNWREHWTTIGQLLEKLEQLNTSCNEAPVLARKSFDSFFITSETLRDAVKRELRPSPPVEVDDKMKAYPSLCLAHDVGIRAKHDVQDEQTPWSASTEIEVRQTDFPMWMPTFPGHARVNRSRDWFVPTTDESPSSMPQPPNRWTYRWSIRCVRDAQPDSVDGLELGRQVVVDWASLLTSVDLLP